MPHFGLIDEEKSEKEEGYLLRSKLHIRCGISRLNQKKYSAGIAIIYDALVAGMHWFVSSPLRVKQYNIPRGEDLYNDQILFSSINNIKKFTENGFDFKKFHELMLLGLEKELSDEDFDVADIIKQFKQLMTKIGIMPFNYEELPPENPDLF